MPKADQIIFEESFYSFLKRAMNKPSILDKNAGELRAILSTIRFMNQPGELEAILPPLWGLGLVTPKIHNNSSTVIAEIEKNIRIIVKKPEIKRAAAVQDNLRGIANEVERNKMNSAEKIQKATMDFIKE